MHEAPAATLRLSHEPQSKAATVEIFDIIDAGGGFSAKRLDEQLKALGDVDELRVLVHSRGGSVFEAAAVYTILANFAGSVVVDVVGVAASAAAMIAMAGKRVRISETGHMMIHDPWMMTAGNAERLRRDAKRLDDLRPSIVRAFMRRVKVTERGCREIAAALDRARESAEGRARVDGGRRVPLPVGGP